MSRRTLHLSPSGGTLHLSPSGGTLNDAMATLAAGVLEDSEHPPPEELLAYDAGELGADAVARLREHLAWCSECADTVADLASWPEVGPRAPGLERTAAEEAADWQAVARSIAPASAGGDEQMPAPIPFDLPAPAVEPPPPAWQPVHLLAAVLLFAVVGLSVQVARLSRRPEVFAAPRANVFVADLEPAGAATRAGDPEVETRVPAGMEAVVFLLVQDDLRPFDDHVVELSSEGDEGDEGDEVFWRSGGLVRAPEGSFSVAVPLAVLPSDAVVIRLYGAGGEQRELVATYRTRIERDAGD